MHIKIAGFIFVISSIVFAVCGLISGSNAWYGVALMSFSIGMLIIMNAPSKGRRQRKKGKFQA